MSAEEQPVAGDQVRVSVLVAVEPGDAFRLFTEEIDQWWRRGLKYRVAGTRRGIIHLEPRVGGRLFESFEMPSGTRVVETGRVTAWEPPARLVFEWRAVNPTSSRVSSGSFKARAQPHSGQAGTAPRWAAALFMPSHPLLRHLRC